MKQIFQSLKTGEISLTEVPACQAGDNELLIRSEVSLISLGTERMLLEFGKGNWISKALQQPDKVKQTLQKLKTDGFLPAFNSVQNKLETPLALGYCNAGTVLSVGRNVSGFNPGDRVASNGFHAELVSVPANLCAKIPDEVSSETAAFTVASSIALQSVRLLNPTLGERIGVIGLGLIGLLTCQILIANGCKVIGFDPQESRRKIAKSYGAAVASSDLSESVSAGMDFSDGYGLDGVIVAASTSSSEPMSAAPQMCRKRGRVVLVGVTGLELSRDDFYKKEISFQVSSSYGPGRYDSFYEEEGHDYPYGFVRWTVQRNFQAVLELMADKKLKVDKLISSKFAFEEAEKAYKEVCDSKDAIGILLEYDTEKDLSVQTLTNTHLSGSFIKADSGNAALIGAGNFANKILIPELQKSGFSIKAVASKSGASAAFASAKYGIPIMTTNTDVIFSDNSINSVIITTRHDSHAEYAIKAIKSGKHVYVEKPLAMTVKELENIKNAYHSQAEKPVLTVGYNRRFSPLSLEAKRLLGETNAPVAINILVNAGQIQPDHWTQDPQIGGGRVIGEVCHFIDLALFLAGSEITATDGVYMKSLSGYVTNDTLTASLSFKNGSIASICYFANGSKDFPKEKIEIFSDGKTITIDNFKSLKSYGFPNAKNISLWSQDKGHQNCVKAFYDGIRTGVLPIPDEELFQTSLYSIKLAEKAFGK